MRTDPTRVPADASLRRMRELVPLGSTAHVFAVDDEGRYVGAIDTATIHDQDLDAAADGLVADDLAGGRGVYLLPGQDVRSALSRFVQTQEEVLPVVQSPDVPVIVGYLTEAYALRLYAEEMERQRSAELGERNLFGVRRSK